MNSHTELEAMRAMIITNKFMVHALVKTHPDPAGLRSEFLSLAHAYVDEQSARPDNEIFLKNLKGHIERMERTLQDQTPGPQRS